MATLKELAKEIRATWKNICPSAAPYLEAMAHANSITDKYLYDDMSGIVLGFLANAQSYRGEDARRIKGQLKQMLNDIKK